MRTIYAEYNINHDSIDVYTMHLMCRHTQNGTEYPEKKL